MVRLCLLVFVMRDGFIDGEKNRTHVYNGGDCYDDFPHDKGLLVVWLGFSVGVVGIDGYGKADNDKDARRHDDGFIHLCTFV